MSIQSISFSGDVITNPGNYIRGGEDIPPALVLLDNDNTELVISTYGTHYCTSFRDTKDNNGKLVKQFDSKTKYSFMDLFKNKGGFSKDILDIFLTLNDVFILGVLSEAVCKVGAVISILHSNTSLVDTFVNQTFEYYGINTDGYSFSFNRAVQHFNDKDGKISYRKSMFLTQTVQDESGNTNLAVNALVRVSRESIVVDDRILNSYVVFMPDTLAHAPLDELELNYIYDAVIWYVLMKVGFIFLNGGFYSSIDNTSSSRITPMLLTNSVAYDAYNPMHIF